jgi:hypothetical protein
VLLKTNDVKAEDWMKSPQGRSKMSLFCYHCIQADFPHCMMSFCVALFCSMVTIHERELPCPYRKARLLDYTALWRLSMFCPLAVTLRSRLPTTGSFTVTTRWIVCAYCEFFLKRPILPPPPSAIKNNVC